MPCRKRCTPCRGCRILATTGILAVASSAPVNVAGTALYNYTEGYGSYLIPAVMIIIIFQTLLMVIGMVTGEEAERTDALFSHETISTQYEFYLAPSII